MRNFTAVLPLVIALSGCSQIFEGNLFKSVDSPPKVSASSMADASLSDIKNQIADPNTASAFYTQLKDNPDALAALQDNLAHQADTATTPASRVDIAQTLVLVTAYGTDTSDVVNDAIHQADNLKSGGTPADAVKALMAGKSEAEIEAKLTQFQTMQSAFKLMQDNSVASSGHAVDQAAFYGTASSATQGDLAQIALVSAAADALVRDNGSVANLAAILAADGTPASGANMTAVSDALNGSDVDPTSNLQYAYLSAVTGIVPF